ncbi:MAG: AgmX/PglI C-terminal domain-containing protein [Polyangiales bacterium]
MTPWDTFMAMVARFFGRCVRLGFSAILLVGCAAPIAAGPSIGSAPDDVEGASLPDRDRGAPSGCTEGLDEYDRDQGVEGCYLNLPACIEWCEAGDAPSCLRLAADGYGARHPELVERLCAEGYLHACVVVDRRRWTERDAVDVACAGERLDYACQLGNSLACFTRAFYLRTDDGLEAGLDESFLEVACETHNDPIACGAWAAFYDIGEFGLTPSPDRAREIRAGYCRRRPEDCQRDPGAPHGLTAEMIRHVVRFHLPEVVACYEPHVAMHHGTLSVRWVIGPDGQVTDAVALNALHPPLDDCVLERVRAWRFPPPSGGVVSVTYPFTLVRSP